jgi:hypothetical protein
MPTLKCFQMVSRLVHLVLEFKYPEGGNKSVAEKIKELSYLKYGGDREEVEAAIMEKYKKEPLAPLPPRPGLGAFGL